MKSILSHLEEIENIQQKKLELTEKEKQLIKPLLTDQSDIFFLYDVFVNCAERIYPDISAKNPLQRSKFILIALYLYAPKALITGRFPPGIRKTVSLVMDNDPSLISHNFKDVMFQYKQLKNFKGEVDYLCYVIIKELKASGKVQSIPW